MRRSLMAVLLAVLLAVPVAQAVAAPVTTTWTPERNLSLPGAAAFSPDIVSSPDGGTLVAAWHRYDGLLTRVQVSRSTDGGQNWTTPTIISGNDAITVDLAHARTTSRVVAVWLRQDGPARRVEASMSNDGGLTWSPGVFLSAGPHPGNKPAVKISGDGQRAMAVWIRFDGTRFRVQSAFTADGGQTWSSPETLSSAGSDADNAQLAYSADGLRATAVWQQLADVYSSRTLDGGITWSSPVKLSTALATNPQVVNSANGLLDTAIWATPLAGGSFITSAVSSDGGATWSAPLNQVASDIARDPRVTASQDGQRLTAIWRQAAIGSPYRIHAARSADGGQTWSPSVPVSAPGVEARSPGLVGADDGQFVTAVWDRYDGAKYRVASASSTDGGQTWSAPADLSGAGQDAYVWAVAGSGDGRRVATVWDRSDGTHQRIQVATAGVASTPGAPGTPSATPGDGSASLTWGAADDAGSPLSSYTATATPGGQTCTTVATSCTLTGLTNGTAYSVTVTATNAVGAGPASAAATVTPQATPPPPAMRTTAALKAIAGKSKLRVVVTPDLGPAKQWRFTVERKKGTTWRATGGVHTTAGPAHRRIINLRKGTYRVRVKAAHGYTSSTSKAVRLRR